MTDFPIRNHHCGEPIPDLGAIPEEDWVTALTPLSARGRKVAMQLAQSRADPEALGRLMIDMARVAPPAPRAAAARVGADIPRLASPPVDDVRTRRDCRQVSFRLTEDEYAELAAAGEELGLRPAPLARMLTQNGARRILYERRRDR